MGAGEELREARVFAGRAEGRPQFNGFRDGCADGDDITVIQRKPVHVMGTCCGLDF